MASGADESLNPHQSKAPKTLRPANFEWYKKVKVKAYNKVLKQARVRIEHSFGLIKKRVPAFLYQLRCSKISNVQAIIC